ncbi:MAG: ABC transporter permease [Chloroflexi bacterium]|nr:ABC transporter permease [Chloroflexota bacterium]MYD15902.1 ABC transporter permease [Chloroflexota bacterium]
MTAGLHNAARYTIWRMASLVATLLAVSAILFAAVEWLPGDPAQQILGIHATPERLDILREQLNLSDSVPERYARWLWSTLQGDLGESVRTNQPVGAIISRPALNTAMLAVTAFAAITTVALLLAAFGGRRDGSRTSTVISVTTLSAVSVPEFIIAGILISVVGLELGWLPAVSLVPSDGTPFSRPEILVLPVVSLSIVGGAYGARLIRAAVADAARRPHVQAARLAGLTESRVLIRHLLPSAIPTTVQVLAFMVPFLVGGAVVVERIFAFPGLGSQLVDRVALRDAPVIEAIGLIQAAAVIIGFQVADAVGFFASPERRTAE